MAKKPFEFTYKGVTYIQNGRWGATCAQCAACDICDDTRNEERRNNLCGPDGRIYTVKEPTPTTKETKMNPTTLRSAVAEATKTTGKPTAKGLRAPKKAVEAKKPKYPAPREALTYGVTVTGKTTKESIKGLLDLTIEIHNGTLKDLAATGTKLDRALVDLKEAKAKIKELSK